MPTSPDTSFISVTTIFFTIVGGFFSAILVAAVATRQYTQRVGRIEGDHQRDLDRVSQRLLALEQTGKAVTITLGELIQRASLAALSAGDRQEVQRTLTAGLTLPNAPNNPFTPDEAAQYNHYVEMAKNGASFTPEEVQQFDLLIKKFEQDHPDDPNLSGLLILGAFLLGLYLLKKSDT